MVIIQSYVRNQHFRMLGLGETFFKEHELHLGDGSLHLETPVKVSSLLLLLLSFVDGFQKLLKLFKLLSLFLESLIISYIGRKSQYV